MAAFFGDFGRGGWYVVRLESDAPVGAPPAPVPDDLEAVRRYVGFTQAEFDAVAKRRSRAAMTSTERDARWRLADRIAAVLERAQAQGRRTGAITTLCEAYGTSRVMLGRLRREGRLR